MFDIYQINWHSNLTDIPENLENWLFDDMSLTAKLKQKYSNFAVEVISESQINNGFIKREVKLCDGKIPVVYAISIIPQNAIELINLGNKPLGEILFNDGKRLKILVAKSGKFWGRKSIFSFQKQEVIVCEFFLDELLK